LKREQTDAKNACWKRRRAPLRDSAHTCYIKACGASLREP
jgi:hypothetical protein